MFGDLISVGINQMVFIMRTHALYQNKKLLIWLILFCFLSLALALSASWIITARFESFLPWSVVRLERGCLPICMDPFCRPLFMILWMPYALFETGIFILTAWKFYKLYVKEEIKSIMQIIKVIMRDGFMYYIVVLSVALANLIVWIAYPPATLLAVGLLKSFQATICSRMLLNLRLSISGDGGGIPSTYSHFEFENQGDLIPPADSVTMTQTGGRRRQISDVENSRKESL